MTRHFEREIDSLKRKVLSLGTTVEESVRKASTAITARAPRMARGVIDTDIEIDHMEVEVEEECLKILALHQPVAIDLRFIVAVLKINNDLERIGDLAVNIAERALFLTSRPDVSIPLDFSLMADKTQTMLRRSLDALVNMDSDLARNVCASDDEVDAINAQMYVLVQDGIRAHPGQVECLIHYLSVARHLERIADLATNIAEDTIYMISGDIIRHRVEDYVADAEDDEDMG